MKQWLARSCLVGSFTLLVLWPSLAQKQSPGSSQPPTGPGNSPPTAPATSQPASLPSTRFLYGRVLPEGGQSFSEPVSVALRCGSQVVQVIHPDLKGSFQFIFGAGAPQSNLAVDMSAANNASFTSPNANPNELQGGISGAGAFGNRLSGCDVEVSVAGYQSLSKTITDTGDVGGLISEPWFLRP